MVIIEEIDRNKLCHPEPSDSGDGMDQVLPRKFVDFDSGPQDARKGLVSWPRNNMPFVAIKMGRRQGARSGAYLNRYVTDEQCSRRPIFIATLRAAPSWLFFRVARSLRIDPDMLVDSRLEKQPTDLRRKTCYFGDRTLIKEQRGCGQAHGARSFTVRLPDDRLNFLLTIAIFFALLLGLYVG
jgi:hypothetical protein